MMMMTTMMVMVQLFGSLKHVWTLIRDDDDDDDDDGDGTVIRQFETCMEIFSLLHRACRRVTQLIHQLMHLYTIYTLKH